MKEILTKDKKENKKTRNKVLIGLVLAAVLVLGTVGFAFRGTTEEQENKINYGGIDFILTESGLWQSKIQNFDFLTSFNPKETENISVPIFMTINDYYEEPLFFLGEGAAKQEIIRNLGNFVPRMQDACIEEKGCEGDTPIKNCSQANVIIIKDSDFVEINQEDNCIFISSPPEEQVRAADAFLFRILGLKGSVF